MNDTIAAIATHFGSGGIGVIRISGPEAFELASKLFSKTKLWSEGPVNLESHKVCHGYVFDSRNKDIIDEVLLLPMKGPSSYTAEDVVEIQAHAGPVVLRSILDEILYYTRGFDTILESTTLLLSFMIFSWIYLNRDGVK